MGDGYCDTRCNTTQCMFDGEDCLVDGKGTVRMGRYTVFTTQIAANKGYHYLLTFVPFLSFYV